MVKINGYWCRAIRGHNHFCVIIDEIKHLFSLRKCGTVFATVNNIKSTLIKLPISIRKYKTLNDINSNDKIMSNKTFCDEVRRIFAFRNIMAIKNTNEKSILVDEVKQRAYSFAELQCCYKDAKIYNGVITPSINRAWFIPIDSNNMSFIVRNMLQTNGYDEVMLTLREDMDDIIEHINKDYLWLVSNMLQYINTIL